MILAKKRRFFDAGFNDRFNQYRWDKIRHKVGLTDFKFHDLRNYADTPIMPSRFIFS